MTPFQSCYFDDEPREGRAVDFFHAAEPVQPIALFFVHGGGWCAGSRSVFHTIIHAYRQLGFDCASTDYRLAGVNVEQQVADARIGLDLFLQSLAARGRKHRVVLLGSSAGAHLGLLAGLTPPGEYGEPDLPLTTPPEIAGVVVQAAPFTFELWEDILPHSKRALERAVGVSHDGNEELFRKASPNHYIRENMPPIFALHADIEDMFPIEFANDFARRARALGNVVIEKTYSRTEHGFFYSLERWQQREAFQDIVDFVKSLEI